MGKARTGVTPSWRIPPSAGQHQAAEIVALQLEICVGHGWFRDLFGVGFGKSGERGSTGSVSTLRAWAM
jgi:hypothetical protein